MATLPPDKRPKAVDFKLCFICQTGVGQADYKSYVAKPTLNSIRNIIESAQLRYGYGETDYAELNARVHDLSAEQLINDGVSYHKKCYAKVTHKGDIDKAKARFKKAASLGDVAVLQKKKGRPSFSTESSPSTSFRGRREKCTDNIKCVLCDKDTKVKLHDVATKNMGSQFMDIGRNTNDAKLKARLSNVIAATDPLAAVAYDIRYHLPCLVKAKRDIARAKESRSTINFGQTISDLEMLEAIGNELKTGETVLNMNDIQTTYINILEGNGVPLTSKQMYKPYLKQLIMDNIPDVHFNRPPDKTKPEQILSTKAKEAALSSALETEELTRELKILLEAAKIVRRDIANSPNWKFRGTFQDYEPPPLLYTFCKHAIQGPRPIQTERRRTSANQSASVLTQHFVQAYKSDRQVSFKPKNLESDFRNRCETPLSVGLALDVHKNTRSKSLVSKLEQLDIGISYSKVMEIETGIANTIRMQMDSVDGLCLPPWLVKDTFVWYALDNIDFLEATPCGMNTLHGTAIAVYQSTDHNKQPMMPKVEIDRTSRSQTLVEAVEYEYLTCKKPENIKKKFPCKLSSSHPITDMNKKTDMTWIIGCLDLEEHNAEMESQATSSETQLKKRDDEHQAQNEIQGIYLDAVEHQTQETQAESKSQGTWGAFNSLLSSSVSRTNVSLVPPLIRSPPTDYGTLYTGLMRAHNMTTQVLGNDKVTVMTLDLQLYDMAMKLWVERDEMKKMFLFRPGELHVVFWALAALGKYVEGSGIDQAWVEAGLYSPTTVTQILNGKHLYRSLEAHTVTLLALYHLYFDRFLTKAPEEKVFLIKASIELEKAYQKDISMNTDNRQNLRDAVRETMTMFESRDILTKLGQLEGDAAPIQHYISNYLRQFETILQYIRATRQRDLLLHMETTEALIKYFFAHDHLNYARLLPLYLSTMQQTEQMFPDVWAELMKGNFCVTKGIAAFTSIGPDHGIEQENCKLKVIGGITGITQIERALDRYFLIAPELSNLVEEFHRQYGMEAADTREQHHEMTGGKSTRVMKNCARLTEVFVAHGDPFIADESDLCNLLTKEVIDEKVTKDIIERDAIGQELFQTFVKERLTEGKLSVWDPMKRKNIGTFKSANTVKKVRAGDKLVKVKEERGLLQRFIVASRSRPELDLKECIGKYEFGIVPRSLFASDGSLLLAYDKAKVLHHLEALVTKEQHSPTEEISDPTHAIPAPSSDQALSESSQTEVTPQAKESEVQAAQPDYEATTDTSEKYKVVVIDGMALVNSISKTDKVKTCNDFAMSFLEKLIRISANYDEVRLVFDRYVESSLKEQMRKKRTKGNSTYYHIHDCTLIQNISLKDFLSSVKTKAELVEYLAAKTLDHSNSSANKLKKFMVTFGTETKGNVSVPDKLAKHGHEEADTLLLLHALTVNGDVELVIDSPDTDVFLLMIHMYPQLPTETYFLTGKGKLNRKIAINPIFEKLGVRRASAILGFHSFTGSDTSGRFAGRTKDWCMKVFMSCDDMILDALASLGKSATKPSPNVIEQLERFVCLLYRSKTHNKITALRWFLYSNRQAEGESLPPTSGSLTPHILRAHYIAMIWMQACESQPSLPSPSDYGWKSIEDRFLPVMCLNPPAPEAVTKLVKCGCKSGCNGNSCSCRSNKLPCTEVCSCLNYGCSNNEQSAQNIVGDEQDDL